MTAIGVETEIVTETPARGIAVAIPRTTDENAHLDQTYRLDGKATRSRAHQDDEEIPGLRTTENPAVTATETTSAIGTEIGTETPDDRGPKRAGGLVGLLTGVLIHQAVVEHRQWNDYPLLRPLYPQNLRQTSTARRVTRENLLDHLVETVSAGRSVTILILNCLLGLISMLPVCLRGEAIGEGRVPPTQASRSTTMSLGPTRLIKADRSTTRPHIRLTVVRAGVNRALPLSV